MFVLDKARGARHHERNENARSLKEEGIMSRTPSPVWRVLGVAIGVVALQALMVAVFAWPATKIEPRDLPVAVAGPAPAAQAFAGQLDRARPGAFEVTTVPDAAAADRLLRDREAYAAFVLGPLVPPEATASLHEPPDPGGLAGLHVASAASPTVAQLLTQASQTLGQGRPVPVVDVVAADRDDPRGAGLAAGLLPLVLTSIAAGLLLTLRTGSRLARVLGVLTYAVLAGLAATAIVQYALGALPGDYLANAAVVALLTLAMAAAAAGLGASLGPAGVALAVLAVFLVGNPLSGVASAPELLPQPWGVVGQLLPPGAGGTLLRSVAFFDGAGAALPAWVLTAWAAAGLLLAAIPGAGRLRAPSHTRAHDPIPLRAQPTT
jgi:hypothetical protein